jgi:hypothetical protein
MLKIAEEEEQEVEETSTSKTSRRKKRASMGSDVTMEGLTDESQSRYEDLVS